MSALHNVQPPLWSGGQSSWLTIRWPVFFSRHYQIFLKKKKKKKRKTVVGLERGPLSLVSTTEELLGRKSRGSCLENREHGRRDPSRWPRDILYPHKLALTSPTSGSCLVGIVRSRTQTMEFFFLHKSRLVLGLPKTLCKVPRAPSAGGKATECVKWALIFIYRIG
jgi:hypothetical protein